MGDFGNGLLMERDALPQPSISPSPYHDPSYSLFLRPNAPV